MNEVTIILPTYNEAQNIGEIISQLRLAVPKAKILVIDDNSPDGTAWIAERRGCTVIRRSHEKGLSSAVIEGLRHTTEEKVVVMDADLQHPPEAVPELLRRLDTCDVVIGSRYCPNGKIEGWRVNRRIVSRVANFLAWPLASRVADRTSGFFALRRCSAPPLHLLGARGFKILLEILVKGNGNVVGEVPITFKCRKAGESKFKGKQAREYLVQLAGLASYKLQYTWRSNLLRRIREMEEQCEK